ncbi:uncharacterized protein BDZ99DRAFT_276956 [Mytilinidion resinicola]|uniref:DUF7082 domain-containing protein n=1 Tax=Mytilinidion resinicola TaxID=574789 RepID=A0A6A6YSN0_9PEZI|nr:uncharacterized protein BDZ99DRAFT_276956 [Mytilinidion resinicola]KAF2811519.1 hypothetical protein BDZ99DRAFT_276956 [Mytilinidion resinicola]
MAKHWSQDELDARRRLVQFRRSQSGATITTSFGPVSPEHYLNSGCVSCILWEEKGGCYITSTDIFVLLEFLLGVRMSKEQKDRIRRNLENFKPTTISKSGDTEKFFNVIMKFPNPMPRILIIAIKVFPWEVLGHVLIKSISKYYASTLVSSGQEAGQ